MFKKWFGSKQQEIQLDPTKIPQHVAIIMDGNGRWAQKRGLPRTAGHQRGVQALKQICFACGDLGIKYLSVYAFSTENWERPKSEVSFLMNLFMKVMQEEIKELEAKNVQVRILGRKEGVDQELIREMKAVEDRTSCNDGLILNICFNYGGRAEIVDAVKGMMVAEMDPDTLDENKIKEYLYTTGIPDVELMIRTSGEQRLSNFLLYQSAYAEIHFTPVYWPDFSKDDLVKAVLDFQTRERRFGRITKR